jgi:hypothetical protein
MIEVSFFPILFAGIAAMLIAFVWYDPRVFGSAWSRMNNMTPEMVERGKKKMLVMAPIGFLASMVIAYVMSYFGIAWGVYDVIGAIELGFWCWAGFVAPILLGVVLWEQKPFTLYLINVGYWLVSLIAMAVVLLLM